MILDCLASIAVLWLALGYMLIDVTPKSRIAVFAAGIIALIGVWT